MLYIFAVSCICGQMKYRIIIITCTLKWVWYRRHANRNISLIITWILLRLIILIMTLEFHTWSFRVKKCAKERRQQVHAYELRNLLVVFTKLSKYSTILKLNLERCTYMQNKVLTGYLTAFLTWNLRRKKKGKKKKTFSWETVNYCCIVEFPPNGFL